MIPAGQATGWHGNCIFFLQTEKARPAMFKKQRIQLTSERLTLQAVGSLLHAGQKPEDRQIRVIEIRNFDGVPLFPFFRHLREGA
jgi:hypothetical protein